ncbi:ADP-heptose--lipooligosaccharide heptosyltransferase II [hydrothermal vent metagenome]|uniref:lipopolysaccharide heptosyltransferase II n=1 Tax=hydrothermal vent metagenome TaxID=652676 RepID=A0A1W1CLJ2_9ZZZZ
MMQSLLIAIKNKYPKAKIDVIANKLCLPLAEFMPQINQVIELNTQHGKFDFNKRKILGKSLKGKYDLAIILPITWKSALVPFFANIPERIGFLGEMRFGLINNKIKLNKQKTPLMVDRYLLMLSQKITKDLYPKFNINTQIIQKSVALCPGASYGPAKKWPVEYFYELAEKLTNKGYLCFIFGSQAEKKDADKIKNNNPKITNYVGKLTLKESIKKMSEMEIIISNDSGLMHIASALNKKVIAIFGSSTPKHTPPLNDKAIILQTDEKCRPCFAKTCRFDHYNCLKNISVSDILKVI